MALIKMDEKIFRKNKNPQICKSYSTRVFAEKKAGTYKGRREKWLGHFDTSERLIKYIREITTRGIVFHWPGRSTYFHPDEVKKIIININE